MTRSSAARHLVVAARAKVYCCRHRLMEQFFMRFAAALSGAILIGTVGCSPKNGNPPPTAVQPSTASTTLPSKDVGSAIDEMATDLLTVPELNAAGHQWTMVIADVNNRTIDPSFTYETFSRQLASRLGNGRVISI